MAPSRSGLAGLIQCSALAGNNLKSGFELAARRGLIHTRSAVGGTTSATLEEIGQAVGDAFFTSVSQNPGVFDTIAQRSRRAQFHTRMFIPTAAPTAHRTDEGTAVRLSKVALNPEVLTPVRVAAMVVETDEAMATPEGAESVELELRGAVTLATDTEFLSILGTGAGFTGGLTGNMTTDIWTLASAVNQTGYHDLVLVASPEIATSMACDPETFPDMSPTGGTACGITAMVSAACPGLMLIDCTAIATGAQAFTMRYSTSATIEMDDEPAMDSGTPTGPSGAMISCFQTNATAVIAERSFAAMTVRSSGVALLVPETT